MIGEPGAGGGDEPPGGVPPRDGGNALEVEVAPAPALAALDAGNAHPAQALHEDAG